MHITSIFTRFSPALIGLVTAAAFTTTQAVAGPAASMAEKHFSAIASGNAANIGEHYSDDAVFQWIGGPLDGVYTGPDAISSLWSKFTKAQGKINVDVLSIEENSNGKGTTVNAAVKFMGKKTIPVRYILVYRGSKLVNEIWQIAPNLSAASQY